MQVFGAEFAISQQEAVKLKFEGRLDDIVKSKLSQQLIEKLFKSNYIQIESELHQHFEGIHTPVVIVRATIKADKPKQFKGIA